MQRQISGGEYASGLGKRFGVFVALTLIFPFLVLGIVEISARKVSGAAGVLALIIGIYLKPVIYLCFAYSTARISLRRARTIGISPIIGLCIPMLVLADLSFGITLGSFRAVGFSLGIMSSLMPASLLAAVIAMVTLSFLREMSDPISGPMAGLYGAWRILLFIFLGLGIVGMLPTLAVWFLGVRGVGLSVTLMTATSHLKSFLIYPHGLLLAFAVVSIALILQSRRPSPGGGSREISPNLTQVPMFGPRKH